MKYSVIRENEINSLTVTRLKRFDGNASCDAASSATKSAVIGVGIGAALRREIARARARSGDVCTALSGEASTLASSTSPLPLLVLRGLTGRRRLGGRGVDAWRVLVVGDARTEGCCSCCWCCCCWLCFSAAMLTRRCCAAFARCRSFSVSTTDARAISAMLLA